MSKRSIFWFKRDLRIEDNTGLYHAVKESKEVIPLFILDSHILKKLNPDNHRLGFLMDALQNLENELEAAGSYLMVVEGDPEKIFPDLFEKHRVDALYLNKAYGLDGAKRDKIIRMLCLKNRVEFKEYEDTFLVPPDRTVERKVFTPFYKLWSGVDKRTDLLTVGKVNSPALEINSLESIKKSYRFPNNKYWPIEFPKKRLKEFEGYKSVHKIRHKGLLVGLELTRENEISQRKRKKQPLSFIDGLDLSNYIMRESMKRGVFLRSLGNIVTLIPPLAMPRNQLNVLIDTLHDIIKPIDEK